MGDRPATGGVAFALVAGGELGLGDAGPAERGERGAVNEPGLDGVAGLELFLVDGELGVELPGEGIREVDLGRVCVFEGVSRGAGLAFGGFRAVGAGAVAAGGFDLGIGAMTTSSVVRGLLSVVGGGD